VHSSALGPQIDALYAQGKSWVEIAAILGVKAATLISWRYRERHACPSLASI